MEREQAKPEEEQNGELKYIRSIQCIPEKTVIKLVKSGEIMGEMIGHSTELGSYPKQI